MSNLMRVALLQVLVVVLTGPSRSEETGGQSILKDRCGRCHAVTPDTKSPIGLAPNLWEKLRTYPPERLEIELAEGMGSRHPAMPQIQFSSEDIASIQSYLAGDPK
jgi:mono/diheme cytochrome c family protein